MIHEDRGISGAAVSRPGLRAALDRMRVGDIFVVWKLDRLGRSLPHLIKIITDLQNTGAEFQSLQEQIDTASAGGRFYFHMLGALAEFERELIAERTRAGMAAAKRNGVHVGRPRKLTEKQILQARKWIALHGRTQKDVANHFGVNVTTLRRALHSDQELRAL